MDSTIDNGNSLPGLGSESALARAIAQDAGCLALLLTAEGVVVDGNQAMATILGQPLEQVRGTLLWPHLPSASRAWFQETAQKAMLDGQRQQRDIRIDGRWYHTVINPFPAGPGKATGITMLFLGRNNRKRLEEAPFLPRQDAGQAAGLGLSAIQGLVHKLGGWLEVESDPGLGSIFHGCLPAEESGTLPCPATDEPGATGGRSTILIIEDTLALRKATRRLFTQAGYPVLEAANAEEALTVWRDFQDHIDLVYSDVVMPGQLSGLQLAEKFRADKPGLRIILTSGYNLETSDRNRIAKAAIVYLPKPVFSEELIAIVQGILGRVA